MDNKRTQDKIYAVPQKSIGDFVFDEQVANVFDDMIQRSVPGYNAVINMIGVVAQQYAKANSRCYDLGCSLGRATRVMQQCIRQANVKIIAVDNSPAMIAKCRQNIFCDDSDVSVEMACCDIRDVLIANASVVVLNFTLQFIDVNERSELIKCIYEGVLPGGILVISEKIAFADSKEQQSQESLHHAFKKFNGYSDLEIAQKRTALEKVLIPDTLTRHHERLHSAGFAHSHVWFQCFNFASIISFK